MTLKSPDVCPHCGADFSAGACILTSSPERCGRCHMPLTWIPRSAGEEKLFPCQLIRDAVRRIYDEHKLCEAANALPPCECGTLTIIEELIAQVGAL